MKKITLILMIAVAFAGCNQTAKKAGNNVAEVTADNTIVNVFYFHGKQRCKTCVSVQNVTKETVEKFYSDNVKVVFHEINTSEKANEALCEKYEISWNALIIAKGEDFVEITDQAFATAVNNPQALESLITTEINKRLAN